MKGDLIMKTFTMNEMETIFEIGRAMQCAEDDCEIVIEDSKNAFMFALAAAIEFEEKYPNTENYYCDIDNFIGSKIKAAFGFEN
jgi:hypothetical protein